MTEIIDAQGRWILIDELCRWCGRWSKDMHPAGVIAGRWKCTSCGRHQHEADDQHTQIGED